MMGLETKRVRMSGRYAYQDIVCSSWEIQEKFIRELRDVANHVNTRPNSLGRVDKHKINHTQKQLHPSQMGTIDLLESSKDVGQSGMLSPWGDADMLAAKDVNKYPNIKYDLFKFITDEFTTALTFDCDNIVDYNKMLDKLVMSAGAGFYTKIPDDFNNEEK